MKFYSNNISTNLDSYLNKKKTFKDLVVHPGDERRKEKAGDTTGRCGGSLSFKNGT